MKIKAIITINLLFLNECLIRLGFNVLFDQNYDSDCSIAKLGTNSFMNKLMEVDFVCALMSPLYYDKMQNPNSGVSFEVTKILERVHANPHQPNYWFFLPLFLHESNPDYETSLLGAQGKLKEPLFYDFRDRRQFYLNFSKFLTDGLLRRVISRDHESLYNSLCKIKDDFHRLLTERLDDEVIFEAFERQLTIVCAQSAITSIFAPNGCEC